MSELMNGCIPLWMALAGALFMLGNGTFFGMALGAYLDAKRQSGRK